MTAAETEVQMKGQHEKLMTKIKDILEAEHFFYNKGLG